MLLEPGCLDAYGALRNLQLFMGRAQALPLAVAGASKTIRGLGIVVSSLKELRLGAGAVSILLECASLEKLVFTWCL